MVTADAKTFDIQQTGRDGCEDAMARPQRTFVSDVTLTGAVEINPLRRLVAWLLQGNSSEQKAARDLEDMIERLAKISPHLLDDVGMADKAASKSGHDTAMGAQDAVTPVSFYVSERFATK